ncbi:hypothetical protein [Pseudomonas fluorescens]|uniref:hypothetical protein n=1 Tax=Pseudomonas fluorescens TaxID=294 RepID=UPI003D249BF9
MTTISYVSMTTDLDGKVIEPLTTKTMEIPQGTEFDENGEAEVNGAIIYSAAHDKSECAE